MANGVEAGVGLTVDFDAKFIACGIGTQVDAGLKEAAQAMAAGMSILSPDSPRSLLAASRIW